MKKGYVQGTHRTLPPMQTIERITPLLRPAGITRIANITGLDRVGLPVVSVVRPNSRSLSVSQGKGLTLAAAKASGAMEALELYHAERIHRPLVLGSDTELRDCLSLVDPATLPSTTGSHYHDHYPLLWIEARDLRSDASVWVPFECVHTNACSPEPTGSGCFASTSNGLASGNHLLEAISHGLCEVVERDATAMWHLLDDAERRQTRIHLATVDDDGCQMALERFERAGLGVLAWETTSDVGIPAFVCTVFEDSLDRAMAIYTSNGAGCHPDKRVALARALTEAAQSRLTLIAGNRDDLCRRMYQEPAQAEALLLSLHDQWRSLAPRSFASIPSFDADDLEDDLAWELDRLQLAGFERVLVVNLTRQDFALPVARVIVPGLEGSDEVPDYVPGARALARCKTA